MNHKKTSLAIALSMAMGVSATASADIVSISFSGLYTLLGPDGSIVLNSDSVLDYGLRTSIVGTASFDMDAGTGSGSLVPFSFIGNGFATATNISFQAIGDGFGNPGTLILANMGLNWNYNNGIPISVVIDASGFMGAMVGAGVSVGQTITGVGAVPASNNASFSGRNIPIGPSPFSTTTWNTTDIGPNTLGTNPSGTLPLIEDTVVNTNVTTGSEIGIGGSPMVAGAPYPGFSANFDFTSIYIDSCIDTGSSGGCASLVPVPATVWLFGSGLIGLLGVARRKC